MNDSSPTSQAVPTRAADVESTWAEGPPKTETIPLSHPDVLWHAGLMAGRRVAHPERSRIIELGCGDGANLTPLAVGLPAAELVGVEPDPSLRARAEAAVTALGLGNLTLAGEAPTNSEGEFDYVIVPDLAFRPSARAEPLLARVRALLDPNGIAFFAYPTPPGRMMRDGLAPSATSSRRFSVPTPTPGSGPEALSTSSPWPASPTTCRIRSRRPSSFRSRRPGPRG